MKKAFLVAVCLAWLSAGGAGQKGGRIVEWPAYGNDQGGTKYSPLTQINRDNVATLRAAWEWKTGEAPLPQFGDDPNSARAAAALGREHAQAMAQNLARLSLKDAVESGRHARSELLDAEKRSKSSSAFEALDERALGEARAELERALAWAEQSLARGAKPKA